MCPTTKEKVFEFCFPGSVDPNIRNTRSVTGVVHHYVKAFVRDVIVVQV